MKKAKQYLVVFALFFLAATLQAQKDSIHALFKPVKLGIHYSNLQWEGGYTGYVFNHEYVSGLSLDFFGIVFNDVDLAIGIDEAGNRSGYNKGIPVINYNVQSYSGFYFKIEPMLFPEKLVNLAMPIKFEASTLTYPDTSTFQPTTGYGRRGRRSPSASFFSITPGVFGYVNLFPGFNLGAGVSYRFAFSMGDYGTFNDYNDFTFSVLVRIRVAMRKNKVEPPKNDYYKPDTRFQ